MHRWISLISISVVIISVAFFTSGGCEVLLGPAQKAYPTPSAFVDTPIGEQSGNIEISYRIVDIEGDPVSITVGYSTDSGKTWFPATEGPGSEGTTGLSSSVFPGSHHVFVWDSVTDEIGYSTSVRIRITPDDGSSTSLEGETANFTVVNAISGAQAPVIGWFAAPQGTVQQVPLTFAWKNLTPEVPIYRYYYGLDEDPPTHKTTKTSVKILPPSHGSHTFRVFAMGASGLNSAVITRSFNVSEGSQNEAPSVEILTGPSGTIAETSVSFTWRGVDPDGDVYCYYYNLDDQGWVNVGLWKSASFTELVPGDHTFALYCKDWYGADSVTVYRNFTIDPSYTNFLPTVAITGGPSGGTADNTPTFTWSGSDPDGQVVGYYWRLDAGNETFTSMTQVTLSPLADGSYRFYVKSVDDYGANSSEAWQDFTVISGPGNLPPSVSITSGPTGDTTDTTPSFTWMGSDPDGVVAGYFWHVDSGAETYTTSTFVTVPALPEGFHTFYVKAIDDVGDNSTTDSRSFTVVPPGSNDPPTVTITGGPTGNTSDNTPTFTYSGSDTDGTVTGYYWHVDAGPETYTTSTSATTSALADGPHTFFVTAVDNDGDNSTEDSRAFTVATGGGPAVDFLETFDDGTVDPDLVYILNGSASQSVTGGAWFFDQGTSTSDAHLWYYNKPLDLSKPFVARIRTKTANHIASASQAANVFCLFAEGTSKPAFISGGEELADLNMSFSSLTPPGLTWAYCGGSSPSVWWNFLLNQWDDTPTSSECEYPITIGEFMTLEIWSTPTSFYCRWLDQNGAMVYETTTKNWADFPDIVAGDDVYLCGGEGFTSWLSNDEWIDMIQVDYEPDPPVTGGDFLETFDDGTVDPDLSYILNGAATQSVTGGTWFFDQGTSASDAHQWHYNVPLDLSRPFVARVRVKTDNYIASASQGCHVMFIWATPDATFEFYTGGMCPENVVAATWVGGTAIANFTHQCPPIYGWNFVDNIWETESVPALPYNLATFITTELWSTPTSFYLCIYDESGVLMAQTTPVNWADSPKVAAGDDVYLCGGEDYTSWWSNDAWVDYIQVDYEPDPPSSNNPPTVTITGGPTGDTSDNMPTFTYSGSDTDGTVMGYYWHVDAGPETYTVSMSTTTSTLADGPHTFYVKAVDDDGDNSSEDSRAFTVVTGGGPAADFLETFDDGTVDPDLSYILNGAATQSVTGGTWFFDQGTSASDAHQWHYNVPLDLSRPFVARVRVKTDNYIASASQGCHVMFIWATPDATFEFYTGGMCPENVVAATWVGGTAIANFTHQCPPIYGWNFVDNIWETESVPALPYNLATFITTELWSTPTSFYLCIYDESGVLMAQTTPVNWADSPKVAAGDDVYLCGGEDYTSWWSNDAWVDYIQIDYEP
ncbi:MAG: hypothetical protein E3J72_09695 [Planctomycetota bacterium]|nr:MAG: hypothetical protein E3J72_09695 [Planctomycetota bacterium]